MTIAILIAKQNCLILLGSFLLSTLAHAQSDTIGQQLFDRVDAIESTYYFTNPDSALVLYQEAAALAIEHQLWLLALDIRIRMVWCALHHQRLDTIPTLIQYAESMALKQRAALDTTDTDATLQLSIPYAWGLYYVLTGDYQPAIEAYQKIIARKNAFSDSSLVADTYYSIAVSYLNLENYGQAIIYHQLASDWLSKQAYGQEYEYQKALSYQALGKAYADQALYNNDSSLLEKSNNLFQQALQLLGRSPEERARHATLSTYRALAQWHQTQGQSDSALYYLQQSLPYYRPPEPELIEMYTLWGALCGEKKAYDEAQDYYQKALAIARATYGQQHEKTADILNLMGNNYAAQQQWPHALSYFQQALVQVTNGFDDTITYQNPSLKQLLPNRVSLEILLAKAHALQQLNTQNPADTSRLLLALDTYHLAIGVVDQMRQVFPSLEYKQFLSAKSAALYEQAIGAAYQAHTLGLQQRDFLAEAFYFSEKSKAATLLEATKTAEARTFAGIPDTLLAQENKLKRELTFWENKLYQATEDSVKRIVRYQAFQTREAYHALVQQLEQDFPDYYRLKYSTEVIGLRTLQATLSPGTTLLSFSYGDSSLYTFSIRREAVQLRTERIDHSFNRSLDNVLRYVSQYDYRQAHDLAQYQAFVRDAHYLYRKLVQPSLTTKTPRQLIIIPDGQLGYLPFDVLLADSVAADAIHFQHLSYLIRKFPIRYEYSATLLTTIPAPASNSATTYLGFAPTYDDSTATPAPIASMRAVRATLDGQIIGLSPLRYNRAEVDYAASLFQGKVLAGKEASEQHFKEQAAAANLLHLSMHAYAHDANDDLSGLLFTQQSNTDQTDFSRTDSSRVDSVREDDFLHPNELYSLSLHAQLAVLSACETGMGTLTKGEGIMSLGRAFKYAGCPNVTMSLWKADDQSTHHLMQSFFTHLHAGQPKDEALRQAKLSYLDEAKSLQAHPYYWAAFVQVGDDMPLSETRGLEKYYWLGGMVILSLLGVLFWWYRRGFM